VKQLQMKATLIAAAVMLLGSMGVQAQKSSNGTGKIGKLTVAAFNSINKNGNKMVSAIKPTSTALSNADQQLLMQVAAGGQRQMALSQALLDKVSSEQVKLLAASEVEEQTNVSAKLQEIATAKGITLPTGPDADAQGLVSQTQNLSGADADNFYLAEGGIKGHELLQATMQKVSKSAKDPALKKLATATLPVIRTHLSVSREVKGMMKAGATTAAN
jgi:putative membrane protein